MEPIQWPRLIGKSFGVLATSAGIGFIAGAITFASLGHSGEILGGPFSHVADIVGWGAGLLSAGLLTMITLWLGKRADTTKPMGFGDREI